MKYKLNLATDVGKRPHYGEEAFSAGVSELLLVSPAATRQQWEGLPFTRLRWMCKRQLDGEAKKRASRQLQTPAGEPLGEREDGWDRRHITYGWSQVAARGSGHRTDSRTMLRRKGIVYSLGFQKLKKRAFSPSLKASQKEYIPSNETLDGSTASGPEVQQESSSSWWPGPSPTHVNTGPVKALLSVLQVRSPELPHSQHLTARGSETSFCKIAINLWGQRAWD